jgi:uncharacterized membrane protein YeaQ/YmgE (transglycosylase-associated protein family)
MRPGDDMRRQTGGAEAMLVGPTVPGAFGHAKDRKWFELNDFWHFLAFIPGIPAPQLRFDRSGTVSTDEARNERLISMAIIHCLWIGLLAGLTASRLIRGRANVAPIASCVAVGVLGALLGGLADSWMGTRARNLPQPELIWPALGATAALITWAVAQRTIFAPHSSDKPTDGA